MMEGIEFGFSWFMICEFLLGFKPLGDSDEMFGISFQKLFICIGVFM